MIYIFFTKPFGMKVASILVLDKVLAGDLRSFTRVGAGGIHFFFAPKHLIDLKRKDTAGCDF
jgi:hypothetical protein